ncbi:hypothetical protein Agub_g6482 [Astrephomene gubernaculifera]|uniref:UBA domain-containing protein n=1 Tax=Astrephomene gubernaculifera TaxID=47775 RepID=A0AAD3DNF3_9CHLO|nr:hypothetical protein Agub_g6482 [Astrephomene gubernaculifera]
MAFAAALAEKRGPRVGDAASLWNFTPAPGWTREEVQILRLCLMKHGVGQWLQILKTGLLPGKMIQQLNGQTQRLLGQQSLAAYTGLQVDVDRIRADNEARTEATRKAGLIIYDGPTLTKEMKDKLRKEAQIKYGLTPDQLLKVDEQLEEIASAFRSSAAADAAAVGGSGAAATAAPGPSPAAVAAAAATQAAARLDSELGGLLGSPLEQLTPEQLIQLLKRLRNRLSCLIDRYRNRQSLPPRMGTRWAGEQDAAAVLEAQAAAFAAASRPTGHQRAGSPDGGVEAVLVEGGEALLAQVPLTRQLLAEAAAHRIPPRPPLPGGAAALAGSAAAARKRGGGSGAKGNGRSRSQGSGSAGADMDWSPEGEENMAPASGATAAALHGSSSAGCAAAAGSVGSGARGGKRKASGEIGAEGGAAGGSKRATRTKRPATRYDKYVDDEEYEEEDPEAAVVYGRRAAAAGGGVVPTEALNALTAMGFTPRKARGALQECHFNVEAAVEWLFANCV